MTWIQVLLFCFLGVVWRYRGHFSTQRQFLIYKVKIKTISDCLCLSSSLGRKSNDTGHYEYLEKQFTLQREYTITCYEIRWQLMVLTLAFFFFLYLYKKVILPIIRTVGYYPNRGLKFYLFYLLYPSPEKKDSNARLVEHSFLIATLVLFLDSKRDRCR